MPEKSEKSVADKDWIQTQHMLLGALKDLEAQLKGAAATENKKSEKGKKGKDTGGSFADRMVGKLSADPTKGVFESLKESISETLDPVNIIKSMTGGSKLAGVLTERVMGRNLSTPDQAQTPPNNTTANAPSQDGMSLGDGGNVSENIQLTLSDISVRVDSIATAMGVSAEKQEVALEVQNEQLRLQFENTEVNKKIEKHGEKAEQQYEESKALLEQSADEARETALETAKGGKGGGAGKPGLEGLVPGAGVPGAGGEKEEKGGGILGFISTASGVFKMAGTGLASIAASAEGILPTIGAVAAGALAVTGIAAAADWLMGEKDDAEKTGDKAKEATGNIQEEPKSSGTPTTETTTKVSGGFKNEAGEGSSSSSSNMTKSELETELKSAQATLDEEMKKPEDKRNIDRINETRGDVENIKTALKKGAYSDAKKSAPSTPAPTAAPTAKDTTPAPTAAPTAKDTTPAPTAAPTAKDTTPAPTAAPTAKPGGGNLKNPYSDSDNRFAPEFQQRVAQLMESEWSGDRDAAEIDAKAEYKKAGQSPYRKEPVKKTSGDMAKSLSENPTPGGESRPPTAAPGAVAGAPPTAAPGAVAGAPPTAAPGAVAGAPPTAVKQEELKAPSALSAPRPSSEGPRRENYTKVAGEKVDPTKPLSDDQMRAVNTSKMMGNKLSTDVSAAYDLRKAQDAGKEQAKPQAKPYEKQNTSQLKYAPDDSKTSATAPTAKATTPTAAPTEKATTPTAAPTEKATTPTAAPTEKSGGGKLKNPYSDSDNRFTPEFQQRVAQLMESDDYSIFSEKKERLEGAEIEAKAEYKATGTSPYRKENIEAVKKTSGDMAKSLSENPTPGGESRPPTAAPGAVAGAPPTAVKQEELKAPSALSAPRPSSEGRRGETYTKVAGEKVDPTKPLSDKQMAAVNMSKMMGNPQSPDIQAAYDLRKAQDAGVPASATPPPESGIKLDNTSKENKVAQSAPGSAKGSAGSTTNTNVVTNTAPQTIMQPGMPGPRTSESSFMRAQDRLQARW